MNKTLIMVPIGLEMATQIILSSKLIIVPCYRPTETHDPKIPTHTILMIGASLSSLLWVCAIRQTHSRHNKAIVVSLCVT